jgi:peptidoglycan hydrolase-like protein with peptidoglycan-binding domain/3D (Asp-Asp-Asp) domain-containing protein
LKKLLAHLFVDLLVVNILVLSAGTTMSTTSFDSAFAESLDGNSEDASSPETMTFTISAYYSPLPCQNKYTTGSYEGDIRLNGGGVRGADGTAVYPGMIAAPKSYQFGTKMDIPGVGLVAVHDRGGAIKSYSGANGVYDRLDIWMGYGDKGLQRALNWGKRNVDVVVYGINDSIVEQISLPGYDPAEGVANDCSYSEPIPKAELVFATTPTVVKVEEKVVKGDFLEDNLEIGASGAEVKVLQEELASINYFRGQATGYYGEVTEHAVFKFQQSQMLILDEGSVGAGVFGPKTRDRLNEILSARKYTGEIIANASDRKTIVVSNDKDEKEVEVAEEKIVEVEVASETLLASELEFGAVNGDVKLLQQFLKDNGYFAGFLVTDYFGPITKASVIEFQIDRGIIAGEGSSGAGRVGPSTLKAINAFS